jgi:cyanophycinase-like exopeptidase
VTGRVIVMGSGELAPGLVATHRAGIEAAGADEVVILDTPFGFQENAPQLTDKLVTFFDTSLIIGTRVAELRQRDPSAVDRERFVAAIRGARYVFAGPGSPSYALDIWRDAGVGPALRSVVQAGGTVTFASAASLTLGRYTIPVYEIYKVGERPHWLDGLDVMSDLGLPCVIVPHWNNAEGGNHDTSRCYIGERRLGMLERELDIGILGVDEHTAAVLDFGAGRCEVFGLGTVTLRGARERVLESGTAVGLDEVGDALGGAVSQPVADPRPPAQVLAFNAALATGDGDALLAALLEQEALVGSDAEARRRFRSMLVEVVDAAHVGLRDVREVISGYIDLLLDLRQRARSSGDYATSDEVRDGLAALGIEVRDTAAGHEWVLADPD